MSEFKPESFPYTQLVDRLRVRQLIKIGIDLGLERSGVGYGNDIDDDEYSDVRTSETVLTMENH